MTTATTPAATRSRARAPRIPISVWVAFAYLAVLALALAAPQVLASQSPQSTDPLGTLLPPSGAHWLGTDELGRDLWARIVYGARYSVVIAVIAVAFATVLGTALGLLAALGGRVVSEVLTRVFDLLSAFPSILMALLFATFFGRGTVSLSVAIGIAVTPGVARVIRRQTMLINRSEFVRASLTFGESRARIITRHVLPNALSSVLLLSAIEVGTAILTVSGLSFVGLGPDRPAPEWGSLLSEGRAVINHAWWPTVFPGIAILVTIVAFMAVGRYLQRRSERRDNR